MTKRYSSDEAIPLAEQCGAERPFPSERHRKMMQHVPAEDYALIALQAIMQRATGKITQEFLRRYNRTNGDIPVRRLLECVDYKDPWERHKKAFEMTMILEHNDRVRHTGVGEIIKLQLPEPVPEPHPTVEEV